MKTVILLGMGPTAPSALESLIDHFHVATVIRDVPRDAMDADQVVTIARDHGIPLDIDMSIAAIRNAIARHHPDCVVVSSYNRVLPQDMIEQGRFVNVHYAPLPEYRSRANVNWAIINGESDAAISIHVLAPGLDSGNVLYQQRIPIAPDDTVTSLYEKLNALQRAALGPTIERYLGGYGGEPQDESAATYGCTRTPEDGEVDWSAPTERIYALARALTPPYPGAFTYLGTRRIWLERAAPLADPPAYVGRVPGRVVARNTAAGHVDVLTGDGVFRIFEVRFDDQAARPAAECITSTRQTLGLRTRDLLARLEALEAALSRH
jgi:methionyl-tRNA formyltransferase